MEDTKIIYHELVKKYHPDLFKNQAIMRVINKLYTENDYIRLVNLFNRLA